MRKRVFWQLWTAKAQISLRGCSGWSGPVLSANRIIWHYKMYQWRANTRMKLCACAGWIWSCAFCACSMRMFKSIFSLDTAHILIAKGAHINNYFDVLARLFGPPLYSKIGSLQWTAKYDVISWRFGNVTWISTCESVLILYLCSTPLKTCHLF